MLSVQQAQSRVLEMSSPLPPAAVALREALGLVLAEDVDSDLDLPPYDKSLVDGFAVRSDDLTGGKAELAIVGELFAGQTPDRPVGPGQAVRIMTGAPVPAGADAVVMHERTSEREGASSAHPAVMINDPSFHSGRGIMRRGTELTRGGRVLGSGTVIRPAELGLLASVGRAEVTVHPRPRAAVVPTGNEVVEVNELPGPGQIRNSNGPTLAALTARAGAEPRYLGIARDRRDELLRVVQEGLECDILLLSGGVSAGQLDLVPGVLRELGVREVFHKVLLKPGKPVWFGVAHTGTTDFHTPAPENAGQAASAKDSGAYRSLVFGLPGNPVSGLVCFELFVRPAIRRLIGFADPLPRMVQASLSEGKDHRSDRPTYWPAWLEDGEEGYRVRPVAWHGSPDLRAITDANSFVLFPEGEWEYRAGDRVGVLKLEW